LNQQVIDMWQRIFVLDGDFVHNVVANAHSPSFVLHGHHYDG